MDSVILFINLNDSVIYSINLMDPGILFIYFDGFCDLIQ